MRGLACLWAVVLAGCVDTDPDRVQLEARVENVELAVEQTTLVTVLSGGLDVVLELGDLAEEGRTVERAPALTLVKESDRSLVRQIDALPDGEGFPMTIGAGETRRISFALTTENTLHADQFDVVCAGNVVVAGSVDDSKTGHNVPFDSAPFKLEGCP